MAERPARISPEQLQRTIQSLPSEIREDWGRVTFTLAMSILRHFLGVSWVETHVLHTTGTTGFVRLDFSSDERRETQSFRVVELAESIFNLQHVEGFDSCLARMRTGDSDQIEATYAELDVARFLYIHDADFRFVEAKGTKRHDYDFEITYPGGLKVCADAKCKLESTEIRSETIKNTLNDTRRKQLPPDRPGIIFVKVPQRWLDVPTMGRALQDVGEEFLRGTGRVVSVKFYVSVLTLLDQRLLHVHRYKEISNPRNRFDSQKNWDIFKDYRVPESWNGMPPKWHRIFFQGQNYGRLQE